MAAARRPAPPPPHTQQQPVRSRTHIPAPPARPRGPVASAATCRRRADTCPVPPRPGARSTLPLRAQRRALPRAAPTPCDSLSRYTTHTLRPPHTASPPVVLHFICAPSPCPAAATAAAAPQRRGRRRRWPSSRRAGPPSRHPHGGAGMGGTPAPTPQRQAGRPAAPPRAPKPVATCYKRSGRARRAGPGPDRSPLPHSSVAGAAAPRPAYAPTVVVLPAYTARPPICKPATRPQARAEGGLLCAQPPHCLVVAAHRVRLRCAGRLTRHSRRRRALDLSSAPVPGAERRHRPTAAPPQPAAHGPPAPPPPAPPRPSRPDHHPHLLLMPFTSPCGRGAFEKRSKGPIAGKGAESGHPSSPGRPVPRGAHATRPRQRALGQPAGRRGSGGANSSARRATQARTQWCSRRAPLRPRPGRAARMRRSPRRLRAAADPMAALALDRRRPRGLAAARAAAARPGPRPRRPRGAPARRPPARRCC
jgi:hypothetical protein